MQLNFGNSNKRHGMKDVAFGHRIAQPHRGNGGIAISKHLCSVFGSGCDVCGRGDLSSTTPWGNEYDTLGKWPRGRDRIIVRIL